MARFNLFAFIDIMASKCAVLFASFYAYWVCFTVFTLSKVSGAGMMVHWSRQALQPVFCQEVALGSPHRKREWHQRLFIWVNRQILSSGKDWPQIGGANRKQSEIILERMASFLHQNKRNTFCKRTSIKYPQQHKTWEKQSFPKRLYFLSIFVKKHREKIKKILSELHKERVALSATPISNTMEKEVETLVPDRDGFPPNTQLTQRLINTYLKAAHTKINRKNIRRLKRKWLSENVSQRKMKDFYVKKHETTDKCHLTPKTSHESSCAAFTETTTVPEWCICKCLQRRIDGTMWDLLSMIPSALCVSLFVPAIISPEKMEQATCYLRKCPFSRKHRRIFCVQTISSRKTRQCEKNRS